MKSHNKAEKAILVALPFLVNKKETYHKVCFFYQPAAIYPPGPLPAKYFRRIRA